ncbi:hypothetical protein RBA29_003179 [Cronobacter turicensis]|nr:hypothetical protein [Cronobacter turicensis]EKY3212700.1 hypothetical protein [Cronobacter turicensis]EKY3217011.1 hypothetical protein [Cronobacter turicensis]ELY3469267.1 hypothetical protein [Cronobacter universalis]
MTATEAEEKVCNLLISKESLLVRVRSKLTWDEAEFDELLSAIDVLITAWADRDTVPKHIALAFIDIYSAFTFKDGFYPPEKLQFLEDMSIALQEKAEELFS